jgi:hypothetical protein
MPLSPPGGDSVDRRCSRLTATVLQPLGRIIQAADGQAFVDVAATWEDLQRVRNFVVTEAIVVWIRK